MWLYLPPEFLPSAPVSECWNLPSDSLCQSLAQHATWKGKPQRQASWRRVLKTAHSIRRLSGLMPPPSTVARGAELWISSRQDSLAHLGASPENVRESATNDGSGKTSRGSSTSPDQDTSFSKTFEGLPPDPLTPPSASTAGSTPAKRALRSRVTTRPFAINVNGLFVDVQGSLFAAAGSLPYSGTFPVSGTMRNGQLSPQPRWAPRTNGNGFSFWLTPHGMAGVDQNGKRGAGGEFAQQCANWPTPDTHPERPNKGSNRTSGMKSLAETEHWPTPDACATTRNNRSPSPGAATRPALAALAPQWQTPGTDSFRSRGGERVDEVGLDQQARYWSTPMSQDSEEAGSVAKGEFLTQQAKQWPTPRTLSGGPESAERKKELGRKGAGGGDLQAAVEMWPTPTTATDADPGSRERMGRDCKSLPTAAGEWSAPIEDGNHNQSEVSESDGVGQWSTPRASPAENRMTQSAPSHGVSHGRTLAGDAANWGTPMGRDGSKRSGGRRKDHDLSSQTELWGTPMGRDWKDGRTELSDKTQVNGHLSRQVLDLPFLRDPETPTLGDTSSPSDPTSPPQSPTDQWSTPRAQERMQQNSQDAGMALSRQVETYPTPTSSMLTLGDMEQARTEGGSPHRTSYAKAAEAAGQTERKRLNPRFVEWLMGLPENWVVENTPQDPLSFSAWEMVSSLLVRRLLLEYSQSEQNLRGLARMGR